MSDLKKLFFFTGIFAVASIGVVLSDDNTDQATQDATVQVTKMITDTLTAAHNANPNATVVRDAHAKHHGCVTAEFRVLGNLPAWAAVGVFKEAHTFPAWIRYSNGSGQSDKDSVGDGRGMAIKLMDVEGTKILDEEREAKTQDFLMINHPVFFVRNPVDYVAFTKATTSGSPLKFFFPGVNPLAWRLHEMAIGATIKAKSVAQMLEIQYWSMTPYQLGEEQIKFTAKPCLPPSGLYRNKGTRDFLRENMKEELDQNGACFEFYVQRRTHPNEQSMPIDDPTINWDNASNPAAPYTKVAVINIPQQDFSGNMDFCENLSYTPWHSLPEHRPLGGINFVRKTVYETVSKLRHDLNKAERKEPTGFNIH